MGEDYTSDKKASGLSLTKLKGMGRTRFAAWMADVLKAIE